MFITLPTACLQLHSHSTVGNTVCVPHLGQTILILGAAGGVGLAAVQVSPDIGSIVSLGGQHPKAGKVCTASKVKLTGSCSCLNRSSVCSLSALPAVRSDVSILFSQGTSRAWTQAHTQTGMQT